MYYDGDDKEDLKYMMETCMRADPARHCDIYVPMSSWDSIAPGKSLFNKPTGTGAAIGFLCWQNAMGMYINDVVKWLQGHDFLRVVVFVDDIYVVTNDRQRFLALMPVLRSKLAALKVRMNERKFYLQHFSKGVMCLGTMLKFGRRYMNDIAYDRALKKVGLLADKRNDAKSVLCSLNSHVGGMKNIEQEGRMRFFVAKALGRLGRFIQWDKVRRCFGLKDECKRKVA